ncbi:uncharacterized protein LOC125880188 [Epinephelus fuscoguttatus]|uniref:uncharacterized protein LOC125880188 n=1 Tax=Epinephelus fuscoguttatus TaxID=293821 RepID=UPI0020D1881A|nr:uncharacterized protein LOC125880188 [Epinephelus fuscoguttatus]
MLLKVKHQSTRKYVRLQSGFTFLDFINEVKNKFGLPDAAELDVFDDTDTAVEEDIFLELIEANPDLCLTVRDSISDEVVEDVILELVEVSPDSISEQDFSPSHHSTSSSLTDTLTSLSSSDNDLSSQREWGTPTGRNISSSKVMNRSTTEMVKNALLRKPGGEDVIEEYKSQNSLNHRTRRQLVNILASHMTENHGRMPSRKQKEKYALGIIALFPSLNDPFSPKGYLNQDFLLLFGAETASKLLEKWDTAFRPKVIKEAKHLTQSTELCRLLKAAEKLTENDDTTGRKRAKISPSDAVDKMVHFHKSCCSIDEHLRGREGKQPYILAAGRTQNRIDTFYIVVDKQLIPCQATSSLGAFDELFKSHYVFNLSYDESLVQLYTFVQTTIYNIDVTTTDESPRDRELRAKLIN